MNADPGVAWADETSEDWAAAIRAGLQTRADGDQIVCKWTCPRCGHPAESRFPAGELVQSTSGSMVTLTCGCGIDHSGHPQGRRGCGCYALAVVDADAG